MFLLCLESRHAEAEVRGDMFEILDLSKEYLTLSIMGILQASWVILLNVYMVGLYVLLQTCLLRCILNAERYFPEWFCLERALVFFQTWFIKNYYVYQWTHCLSGYLTVFGATCPSYLLARDCHYFLISYWWSDRYLWTREAQLEQNDHIWFPGFPGNLHLKIQLSSLA